MTPAPPVAEAATLTKFFIYRSEDGGQTLTYVGEQAASNRDAALRKQTGGPPDGIYAVLSVNALKLRKYTPPVKPVTEDVPLQVGSDAVPAEQEQIPT